MQRTASLPVEGSFFLSPGLWWRVVALYRASRRISFVKVVVKRFPPFSLSLSLFSFGRVRGREFPPLPAPRRNPKGKIPCILKKWHWAMNCLERRYGIMEYGRLLRAVLWYMENNSFPGGFPALSW